MSDRAVVQPGSSRTAVLSGAPSGRTAGTLLLEVVNLTTGDVYRAESATGVTESVIGGGFSDYAVEYSVSEVAGAFSERWRDTVPDPDYRPPEPDVYEVLWSATPPATPIDLTTVAAVKAFLQKSDSDVRQDDELQALTTAASSLINSQIARFLPAEEAAEKTFPWYGGRLELAPYFLRSASEVVLNPSGASPVTIAAGDYRLRPTPAKHGVFRALKFTALWATSSRIDGEVSVTGDWGFDGLLNVPADVQHWTNVCVAIWFRKDVAAFSTTLRLEEDRLEAPAELPTAVKRGLDDYADKSVLARLA